MKKTTINILRYAIFVTLLLVILLPLLFVLVSSFKSNDEIFLNPWGLPERFDPESYITIFVTNDMLRYLMNSIIYATITCVVVILASAMAAYAITRMKWKYSQLCMAYFLMGIMVPIHALLVPLYIAVARMGLPGTTGLVLVYIASAIPTAIFILAGYLKGVPSELEEAAVIDGATVGVLFRKVILPILKPSIATVTILTFLGVWNDLILGLVFLFKDRTKTVQLFISQYSGANYTNYGNMLSSIVVAVFPMILVYTFMSEKLVNGMMQGAVKG